MTDDSPATIHVVIYDDGAEGKVSVELESFLQFNNWFGWELDKLVGRWRDWGTPRARKSKVWEGGQRNQCLWNDE